MGKKLDEIAVFVNVRVNSTRCKNKMLRPFAGSSLVDICLEKLNTINNMGIYYGAHEKELLQKADRFKFLNVVKRTYESANEQHNAQICFEILNHINTKWVVWINPCLPFLKMDTVICAVEKFKKIDSDSLTSVIKVNDWFFGQDFSPLTNIKNKIGTQDSDYIFKAAHAFHIYNREYMIANGKPWDNSIDPPYLFPIPYNESHDIDNESEFIMVESLYSNTLKNKSVGFS